MTSNSGNVFGNALRRYGLIWLLATLLGWPALAQTSPTRAPGIRAVVDAFSKHRIVAIAEDHGLTQAGDFYAALVRDPGFQSVVNDIVIEFASWQSQALLDRYIVTGDSVSPDSLRTIWRNTTKVASWEFPIYERWLKAIRAVNLALSPARRMRVLAGDTEVHWEDLHTHDDWTRLGDNNLSFARVITSDVLAKNRKALVVLGSNHLARSGARDGSPNTTTRVEAKDPGAMYVVWLYNGRPGGPAADDRIEQEGWASPSVVPLRATWAGALPAGNRRLQDLADALLYLGPSKSLKREPRPVSDFDAEYRRELDRRSWIEWSDSARARTFLNLPGTPAAGSITEFEIPSRLYRRARRIWVYTPPDYARACGDGCNLLLAFDGHEYLTTIRLPAILDSLVGIGRIPPTIAVLIDNGSSTDRLQDLANRAIFADFIANELLPWVATRFSVTRDPARTLATGSSAGGLASAYLAFKRPDLIGNVLSQSGAFWRGNEGTDSPPYEWLTDQYASVPKRSVRFFLDVGSVESRGALGGAAPSILAANRHLRDALFRKGYLVMYTEVDGGQHSPDSWRPRLPIGVAALFGKGPSL
jgi:enterochelin esterase-like enzyme